MNELPYKYKFISNQESYFLIWKLIQINLNLLYYNYSTYKLKNNNKE